MVIPPYCVWYASLITSTLQNFLVALWFSHCSLFAALISVQTAQTLTHTTTHTQSPIAASLLAHQRSLQPWWSVTVSQVQPPSNQALKQAVSVNCQLSTVIPLHLSVAFAAASAQGWEHARDCTPEREHKNKNNILTQKRTYSLSAYTFVHKCMNADT